ncbi:MAG: hypothetical protein Q4C65_04165 [Eubacteriales bacterium]|nr:hypothetical protein [Eubacteriales bacterium]
MYKTSLYFACVFMAVCMSLSSCAKQKSLNHVDDLAFWGSTPEEAGRMLGVDFSKTEPEEKQLGDLYGKSYGLPDRYPIGENMAKLEFFFLDNETPAGNPLGLGVVFLYFEEGTDLKEIWQELAELYELQGEPSCDLREDGTVRSFQWWSQTQADESRQAALRETVEEMFGTASPYGGPDFSIWGSVKQDGTVLVYVLGTSGAVQKQLVS